MMAIFDLQDDISRKVVSTLQTELIFLEGSLVDRSSETFEVWEASKKVWNEFYRLNRTSLIRARELAQKMVEDFPASPEGYKLLSLITSHYVFMGLAADPALLKNEAERSIRHALSIAKNDEHIYWGLGIVLGVLQSKLEDAVTALQRSIEINPNFSLGYGTLGSVLAYGGRAKESIDRTEFAMRLNPKDPSIFFRHSVLAISYFLLDEYEQSAKWARSAIERASEYWIPHAILTASLVLSSKAEEAKAVLQSLLHVKPDFSLSSMPIEPVRPDGSRKKFYAALSSVGAPA